MIQRDARLTGQYASTLHGSAPLEQDATGMGETELLAAAVPEELGASVQSEAPEETAPEKEKRRGGGVAKWFSLVVVGALVGLVIVVFMKFLDGPVQASSAPTLATAKATIAPTPSTNQLAGLYFDMIYPGIFDQVGQLKNDSQALEQYNISSKKDYRRVIAISVRPLASNLLDDDSSYKFRLINPATYKLRTDKVGKTETAAVMSKVDSSEVTLFWLHQGKLLTISMTSGNPDDVLNDFMVSVEPTLRWRQ